MAMSVLSIAKASLKQMQIGSVYEKNKWDCTKSKKQLEDMGENKSHILCGGKKNGWRSNWRKLQKHRVEGLCAGLMTSALFEEFFC